MMTERLPEQETAGLVTVETRTNVQATAAPPNLGDEPRLNASPVTQPDPAHPGVPHPDVAEIAATLDSFLGARFEVCQPVSIGGMATIFQLRHRIHGGFFVAKVLHRSLVNSPGVVAAFEREACHVARLSGHPSIVPVFDLVELNGTFAMLLPYIEGEDLDRILQQHGRFSRDEALMLAAQLASLLMYAESQGIVHGDLAPGNIRLDHFGTYRLLDFGISQSSAAVQSEPLEKSPIPCAGTPTYNSPEQIRGEVPDIRTDLYSLGLVLAEVLTGEPLLQAPTLEALAAKHLAGDWELPAEILADPPMAELIRKLTMTDRYQRLESAFELSGAISALGVELPSFHRALHPRPSAGMNLPRPRRRRLESA